MKIFLSHSSVDKTIVRRIYEELGAALCHYDQATFDPTGSISAEIHAALIESTHFVLFASPAAIASPWVQGELSRAFDNWMRSGIRKAMVFLLNGAEVQDLPAWLQTYVMREPPTYRHILCRIQSEIDKEHRAQAKPPIYRSNELQSLETKIVVETPSMPGAIVVHGPDGSGRKALINELYARQFRGVAARKLYIGTSAYSGERELYRDLVGLTTIATPSEFAKIFDAFDVLPADHKLDAITQKVDECTQGNQCILIEGDHSLLTEKGRIPEWLVDVLVSLSGKDYPRVVFTALRRPTHLPAKAIDKIVVQEVAELERKDSAILFNWWLKELKGSYAESLKDIVFSACAGSPRQIELGAKLLVQEGAGNTSKIKPHLLKTLEGLSRQLLDVLAAKEPHSTILAFVANAGHITRSDLTQYALDSGLGANEALNDAIAECASYGFLIEDEVCIRMPNYLVRGARAIGRSGRTEDQMKRLLEQQARRSAAFAIDEVTTIAVLNEHCLVGLAKSICRRPRHGYDMAGLDCDHAATPVCGLVKAREMARAYSAIAVRANKRAARPMLAMALSSQRMLKPAAHSTA